MLSLLNDDDTVLLGAIRNRTRVTSRTTEISDEYSSMERVADFDEGLSTKMSFPEKEKTTKLVQSMCSPTDSKNSTRLISNLQEIHRVLEAYREDPSIISPYVPDLLRPLTHRVLLEALLDSSSPHRTSLNLFCSLIYVVGSICGYKSLTMNEVFPHSVYLLESLIKLAASASSLGWETQYVIFLWLSVVVMAPFDLQAIGLDPHSTNNEIYDICLHGINRGPNAPVKKAASVLLSRFLSRKDNQCITRFLTESPDIVALNQILKIVPISTTNLSVLWKLLHTNSHMSVSKDFLRVFASVTVIQLKQASTDPNSVLYQIEFSINKILILGCRNPSTTIREAVAKSIGRIAANLPLEYADQLLRYLLVAISQTTHDYEFHSIMLILGEICRRKTELKFFEIPSQDLVNVIADGLERERKIATPIRDSSCALVWSIARAVGGIGKGKNLISSQLFSRIIPSLLTMALFDTDVNMRRTGAAALQELVGRVGTVLFPCGLKILDLVDFWSVSSLRDCYTVIPTQLVELLNLETDEQIGGKNLLSKFLSHLWNEIIFSSIDDSKRVDWNVIDLACNGLARLLQFENSSEISGKISEIHCKIFTESPNAYMSRIAAMYLMNALVRHTSKNFIKSFSDDAKSILRNLVPQVEKRRLFKEKFGDKLRIQCYVFLSQIFPVFSILNFQKPEKFLEKIFSIIQDGIVHLLPEVASAACDCLRSLSHAYPITVAPLIDSFIAQLESENSNMHLCARRGMLQALVNVDKRIVPFSAIELCKNEVLSWPSHFTGNKEFIDPECRRFAVVFLGKFLAEKNDIEETLFRCLEDYQTDKRGDVGSWVREAALEVLCASGEGNSVAVLSHAFERIDKIREKIFNPSESHEKLLRTLLVDRELSPNEIEQVLSQVVVCIGSTTPCTISSAVERALVDICESFPKIGEKICFTISNFVVKMEYTGCRFGGKIDAVSRLFIPSMNTLSLLLEAIPTLRIGFDAEKIAQVILDWMVKISLPPILQVTVMKSFSKFLTSVLTSDGREIFSIFLSQVLMSEIPVVRVAGAMDLTKWVLRGNCENFEDQLLTILETTLWSSEERDNWASSVEKIADFFGVKIERAEENVEKICLQKDRQISGYAEFIQEEYRLS